MKPASWRNKRQSGTREVASSASPLAAFRSEIDHVLNRFLRDPWGSSPEAFGFSRAWAPALEVRESENEVTVRAEVPGVDPKNLNVTVSGNVLTLSGEKEEQKEEKSESFYHSERRFGSFSRSVELPASCDTESVEAEHSNGVLTIHLKKLASATPKRIPVTEKK